MFAKSAITQCDVNYKDTQLDVKVHRILIDVATSWGARQEPPRTSALSNNGRVPHTIIKIILCTSLYLILEQISGAI